MKACHSFRARGSLRHLQQKGDKIINKLVAKARLHNQRLIVYGTIVCPFETHYFSQWEIFNVCNSSRCPLGHLYTGKWMEMVEFKCF